MCTEVLAITEYAIVAQTYRYLLYLSDVIYRSVNGIIPDAVDVAAKQKQKMLFDCFQATTHT